MPWPEHWPRPHRALRPANARPGPGPGSTRQTGRLTRVTVTARHLSLKPHELGLMPPRTRARARARSALPRPSRTAASARAASARAAPWLGQRSARPVHAASARAASARAASARAAPPGGGSHVARPAQGPRIGVPQPAPISLSWRSVSVPTRIVLVAQVFDLSLTSCTFLRLNTLGASVITLDKTQFVVGVALSNATCLSQLG